MPSEIHLRAMKWVFVRDSRGHLIEVPVVFDYPDYFGVGRLG
jgi:hypothetical protein